MSRSRLPDGTVPIRKPLSQIGGILAAQIGATLLQNNSGGKGILIGGMPGVPPAEVVIIGAGMAGTCAAQAFVGMGAHVTVLDTNLNALEAIHDALPCVVTMISNPINIERACAYADIVVGAVLVPGEHPPIVVTREMVRAMKPRSVIMDISIDEGGCVETSRPTTNEKPTFIEEGVIHYCVPNMPSVVARTSTYAFLNAALPFILELVTKGIDQAIAENPAIEQRRRHLPGESQASSPAFHRWRKHGVNCMADYNKLYQSRVDHRRRGCTSNQIRRPDLSDRQLLGAAKSAGALVDYAPNLQDVEICQALSIGPADYVKPGMQGHLRVNTMFVSANVRKAVQRRAGRFHPGPALRVHPAVQEQAPAAGCRPDPCLPAGRARLLQPGRSKSG